MVQAENNKLYTQIPDIRKLKKTYRTLKLLKSNIVLIGRLRIIKNRRLLFI